MGKKGRQHAARHFAQEAVVNLTAQTLVLRTYTV